METPPVYRFDEAKHIHYLNGKRVPGVSTIAKLCEDSSTPLMYWSAKMAINCLSTHSTFKDGKLFFCYPPVRNNETGELIYRDNPYIEVNEENYKEIYNFAKKEHTREKDSAADRGTRIHDILHKYFLNEPYEVQPDIQKSFDAFEEWVEKFKVRAIYTEQTVYSLKHKYCGIYDLGSIITMPETGEERKLLVDYKSSKSVYLSYMVQSAGYKIAHEEMDGPLWDGLGILTLQPETGYPLWLDFTGHTEELEQAFLSCLQLYQSMKPVSRLRYKHKSELDKALALLKEAQNGS